MLSTSRAARFKTPQTLLEFMSNFCRHRHDRSVGASTVFSPPAGNQSSMSILNTRSTSSSSVFLGWTSSSDATGVPPMLPFTFSITSEDSRSAALASRGGEDTILKYSPTPLAFPLSSGGVGVMGVSHCGSRSPSGVGVVSLLYCDGAAPILPYFSTTAATFLASSSASTLLAASA